MICILICFQLIILKSVKCSDVILTNVFDFLVFTKLLLDVGTPMVGIGVGLLILSKIPPVIKLEMTIFIAHVYESLFVELTPKGDKFIILGVIYRPSIFPPVDIAIINNSLIGVMGNGSNKF